MQARCDLGRERVALQIEGPDEPVVPRLALSPYGIERQHRSDVAVHLPASGFPNRLHHHPSAWQSCARKTER